MKFDEIILQTDDIQTVQDFYTNILSLKLLKATENFVSINVGTTTLTFKLSITTNPTYHYAINIPKNQFEVACEWLRQRTDTIIYKNSDKVDFPNWNAHAIYFYDSVGNIGELIARHDLDNTTDKPFTAESLLNVSEIGLPTSNVPKLAKALKTAIEIDTYVSGGENFEPLGDENGLFICVVLDRNWFPTKIKSVDYPVEVVLKSDKKIDFTFENYRVRS
ncbi:MAG: VOC family protein [Saprospiraceae bacterium]